MCSYSEPAGSKRKERDTDLGGVPPRKSSVPTYQLASCNIRYVPTMRVYCEIIPSVLRGPMGTFRLYSSSININHNTLEAILMDDIVPGRIQWEVSDGPSDFDLRQLIKDYDNDYVHLTHIKFQN
ncbi:hypothetical protein TNCV_2879801 [Trichonephila clavipes]|uniref:Uncharacterized protein n=1 Tax=Trichonephila clavipes TaxID=2585209 RepID=A0A8X6W243_TRICX|nr:hypothetical protein TNCV_2879801 [Trichonephila clavipes]